MYSGTNEAAKLPSPKTRRNKFGNRNATTKASETMRGKKAAINISRAIPKIRLSKVASDMSAAERKTECPPPGGDADGFTEPLALLSDLPAAPFNLSLSSSCIINMLQQKSALVTIGGQAPLKFSILYCMAFELMIEVLLIT
jgi:hypothetical protein